MDKLVKRAKKPRLSSISFNEKLTIKNLRFGMYVWYGMVWYVATVFVEITFLYTLHTSGACS